MKNLATISILKRAILRIRRNYCDEMWEKTTYTIHRYREQTGNYQRGENLGEKVKRLNKEKINRHRHSMVIGRGKGGSGEIGNSKEDTWWQKKTWFGVVNTQCNIQMMLEF